MIMKTALRCLCLLLTLLLALPLACAEGVEKGSREDPYRLGDVCAFTAEVLKDGSPDVYKRQLLYPRGGETSIIQRC